MEAVLVQLRAAIADGTYRIGDKLPSESAMSAEFDVSRSVVREALRALQGLGLTESRTGKGTFVVATGPSENPIFGQYSARDLFEVRRHIEIPVAGYAATRRTRDDLDLLNRLVDKMDEETDNVAWVALDSLFHITIANASGNPVFSKVIEEIRDAMTRQSALLNQLAGRRIQSNVEHRRLLSAIADRSEWKAVDAMTSHLAHVENALIMIVRPPRDNPDNEVEEDD